MLISCVLLLGCGQDESSEEMGPDFSRIDVHTTGVDLITSNSAVVHGEIDTGGQNLGFMFNGVCYSSTSMTPTLQNGDYEIITASNVEEVNVELKDLKPATTYYCRLYCGVGLKVVYSNDVIRFTTLSDDNTGGGGAGIQYSTVADIDGNVYKTVKIGNQWWMAENLRVKHYRTGDNVFFVEDWDRWSSAYKSYLAGYCYFEPQKKDWEKLGLLYNWYAASNSNNIAPKGWRVPSEQDWQILLDELGYYWAKPEPTAHKLMGKGVEYWEAPNLATNTTGFSVLPGGIREENGSYWGEGVRAAYWASTDYSNYSGDALWFVHNHTDEDEVSLTISNKMKGLSIRCVKED